MAKKPKLNLKQRQFIREYKINVERFWIYVDRSAGPNSCWPWKGALSHGYGAFHIGLSRSSMMLANRISYALKTGLLPEAVCHHCDNRACCNPKHLFGGTRADNNHDKEMKGRGGDRSGPRFSRRKIPKDQIESIRKAYPQEKQKDLAIRFNVSPRVIAKVVRRIGCYA